MSIKQTLYQYWEKRTLDVNNFLFKEKDDDKNIYFILEWEILLQKDNIDIAIIWKNEIIWEKSFLKLQSKPVSAKIEKKITYYVINEKIFKKLSKDDKINFLSNLTCFISDRVDLLNEIINNISQISNFIVNTEIQLSKEYLSKIFQNIIDIEQIHIYKKIVGWIIPIYESCLNKDLIEQIEKYTDKNSKIIELEDKYIIKTNEYIFVIKWKKLKSNYVINNVIMHSFANIIYLWVLIEEQKNKKLKSFLDD